MPNLPISQLPAAGSLTGAELFAIVQDGVTKYTTLTSVNYIPGNNYGLFNQTGSSIPVTTPGGAASGSLLDGGVGTLSVPANGFVKGDAFTATSTGKLSCGNNNDLQIQIKADGVVLADTGILEIPTATDKNWRLDLNFTINEIGAAGVARITTAGIFHFRHNAAGAVEGEIFNFINSSSFDTTIPNTLEVEAIWGADATSGSYIYSDIFTLTKTY